MLSLARYCGFFWFLISFSSVGWRRFLRVMFEKECSSGVFFHSFSSAYFFFNIKYLISVRSVYNLLGRGNVEIGGRIYSTHYRMAQDFYFLKYLLFGIDEHCGVLAEKLRSAKMSMILAFIFGLASFFFHMAYGLINGRMMFV